MTVTYTVENAPPMSQRALSFELTDIFFLFSNSKKFL